MYGMRITDNLIQTISRQLIELLHCLTTVLSQVTRHWKSLQDTLYYSTAAHDSYPPEKLWTKML